MKLKQIRGKRKRCVKRKNNELDQVRDPEFSRFYDIYIQGRSPEELGTAVSGGGGRHL